MLKAKKKAKVEKDSSGSRINRRDDILLAAAELFASRGYSGTSIRDVASEVGMLSGSLYYHFGSKEEILSEVHAKGVEQVVAAVKEALDSAGSNPWDRLTAACSAHLNALLDSNPFSQVITPQFTRGLDEPLQSELIKQRDQYESLFASLIDAVPMPKNVSRRYFRLALLGSLNWTLTWYRPGGDRPTAICKAMLDAYRYQLDPKAKAK